MRTSDADRAALGPLQSGIISKRLCYVAGLKIVLSAQYSLEAGML